MLLRRKTRSRIQTAEKALRKGDLKTAIAAYEEAVAKSPDDAKSRRALADAYIKNGQFQDAVREMQALAGAFAASGLMLKAIAACKVILDIDPDHTETQATLAKLYAKKRGGGLGKSTKLSAAMSAALPANAPSGLSDADIVADEDVALADAEIIDADDIAEVELDDDDDLIMESADVADVDGPADVDATGLAADAGVMVEPPSVPDDASADDDDDDDDDDDEVDVELDDSLEIEEADIEREVEPAAQVQVQAQPPADAAPAADEDEAVDWGDDDEDEAVDWGDDEEEESISLSDVDASLEAEAKSDAPAAKAAKSAEASAPSSEESLDLGEVEEALADELADEFADFHEAELELDHLDADELIVGETGHEVELESGDLPEFPLFSELPLHAFEQLIAKLELWSVPPGGMIVNQGEVGQSFFVIVSGTVDVERDEEHVATLGPGEFFGEMALLSRNPRTASVMATSEAELFEIKRSLLDEISAEYPSVEKVMMKFCRERLLGDIVRSRLFQGMSEELVREMVGAFKTKRVDMGHTIVKQGNKGRGLYVILAGEVDVSQSEEGEMRSVSQLKEGDVFGEMSLLFSEAASATVSALKNSTLLMLSRKGFDSFCERHPLMRSRLEEIGQQRREANEAAVPSSQIL